MYHGTTMFFGQGTMVILGFLDIYNVVGLYVEFGLGVLYKCIVHCINMLIIWIYCIHNLTPSVYHDTIVGYVSVLTRLGILLEHFIPMNASIF